MGRSLAVKMRRMSRCYGMHGMLKGNAQHKWLDMKQGALQKPHSRERQKKEFACGWKLKEGLGAKKAPLQSYCARSQQCNCSERSSDERSCSSCAGRAAVAAVGPACAGCSGVVGHDDQAALCGGVGEEEGSRWVQCEGLPPSQRIECLAREHSQARQCRTTLGRHAS